MRSESPEREPPARKAIRGTFADCCASAGRLSAKSKVLSERPKNFLLMNLLLGSCRSLLLALCSLLFDHSVRSHQHIRRNRQADLFRRLQIDHKFELRRPLNRQVGWLGAFQNLVDVRSGAPEQVREVD